MIDVPSLLGPVTGHSDRCGVPFNESETILQIEEAMRADDPSRDDGVWTRADRKQADWTKAQALTSEMIKAESKDFRLLGVLASIEAQLDGLQGLVGVVELAARLVQTFGPDLHPRTRSGDVGPRLKALSNFDQKLAECINALVRRYGASGADSDGAESNLLRARLDELQRTAVEGWELQAHPFGFTKCKEALAPLAASGAAAAIGRPDSALAGGGAAVPSGLVAAQPVRPTDSSKSTEVGFNVSNSTLNREAAMQQLRDVATLFRRIEPHSPVAPLVEQAIRWANQPLEQWLAEVIPDADVLSRLRERLGIPAPAVRSEE